MLHGNEIVNKLKKICTFLDSRVPLNYIIRTSHFPDFCSPDRCKRRKNGRILKKKKTVEFLGSAEEWHHVSDGRREREARPSLLHSLSRGVQRIQPRPSIQPIIKFIFSPHFVGLETWNMPQRETPFPFPNYETKKKPWDFHTLNRVIRILLDWY